jgi:DNA-binding MarR family transcriptional regulator
MPTAIETALASSLRLSVMRLARRLRAQRADTSLTLSQLAALATLDVHGALTPGELAAHEKISPPSMTKIVAVLEGSGLVDRTPHPTDGRQVVIDLTPAADELLGDEVRAREAWLSGQLQELTAEERAVLREAAAIMGKLASG